MSNGAAFHIDESALALLNEGGAPSEAWAIDSARSVLDRCLRNGTLIVVTDANDRRIGTVTHREGDQFAWTRED